MKAEKFRKKPVEIEAIQFDGHNGHAIERWSEKNVVASPVLEPTPDNPTGAYLQVKTLEGVMTAGVGDWIIRGVLGEYYPCKDAAFQRTYEKTT